MWKQTTFDGSGLGLPSQFTLKTLVTASLPRMTMRYDLFSVKNEFRAHFTSTSRKGGGSYGVLEEFWRDDGQKQKIVLIKSPRVKDVSLRVEAFIQWIAQKCLAEQNLGSRIPQIVDLFTLPDGKDGFTMVEVQGSTLASTFLSQSKTIQHDILHIIAQTAILLHILEIGLGLDHRDLKADNLIIVNDPSILTLHTESTTFKVYSPFTVILVDFGFACLGAGPKGTLSVVNAGDTLPQLDPCPKEGRDLFHLIVSLYSVHQISSQFTPQLEKLFEEWMTVDGRATHTMAKKWASSEWIYLLTSTKQFVHLACSPVSILQAIRAFDPTIFS